MSSPYVALRPSNEDSSSIDARATDDDASPAALDTPVAPRSARVARDVAFARAFAIACATTVAIGVLAWTRVSAREWRQFDDGHDYGSLAFCQRGSKGMRRARALLANEDGALGGAAPAFAAGVGAIFFGVGVLHIVRAMPRGMTWGMIAMQCGICASLGIGFVFAGEIIVGFAFLAWGGVFAYWMYETADRVELVAKLLGAAATALKDNPHLITVSAFAGVGLLGVLLASSACVLGAAFNGSLAPVAGVYMKDNKCYSHAEMTNAVDCCEWEFDSWVPAYFTFTSLVTLWCVMIMMQMRTFVIAGTVSKWYFAPVGTMSFAGTTREFIGHAWTTSFGSLAFAALVMTGVSILRHINEQARKRSRGFFALVAHIVTAFMDCISTLIETLTKFATIQCAISGEDLCTSGREVTRLLNDNFLSAVRVWWLPEYLCGLSVFFLSIAYSLFCTITFGLSTGFGDFDIFEGRHAAVFWTGLISAYLVLSFFFNVLLSCVDSVFICYALDKDRNTLSKPDIYSIYTEVTEKSVEPEELISEVRSPTQAPGRVFTHPGDVSPITYGHPTNDNL